MSTCNSELRHPNVVLFLGACLEQGNVFFITEFVSNGNLHEMVSEFKPPWIKRVQFARDIARGLTYLHENEPTILHRDLKSLNVLVRGFLILCATTAATCSLVCANAGRNADLLLECM